MRRDLVWQTLIGFVGFFAFVALVQAVLNLFRPEPLLWPGVLAGALCLATFWLTRRWLRWRSGPGSPPSP
ncbi:hypothetical protein G7Y29_02440 [Corynebacterium qintianiae]|uniref:Uncharacterized protein n=1 Tax=Corynebacterium qintianiae TaxID=2709392 RepID=A0A7T0PFB5_9CORY|nr:hypothetical protein [Corynebacterium qintianiae]QPK83685.1 hypothetical protein G7Y29_02440 [Corynebacterium qintianiae]